MHQQQLKLPDLSSVNRGVRVMLIEDDDVYAGLVERTLCGDKRIEAVIKARDGEEAQELLESDDWPDLIITDLSMPKVDGVKFLHNFREAERRKNQFALPATLLEDDERSLRPVVVMTSSDKATDYRDVVAADGNCFVTKPSTAADLRLLLRKLIHSVIWAEPLPTLLTLDGDAQSAEE